MAVSYISLDTENLGNNQVRKVRAYNVPDAGVVINVYVELTIKAPYKSDTKQAIVDEEVFVPNVTVSQLASTSFTTIDTVSLDAGQKRIIRQFLIPTGGKVLSVVATADFKQGNETKTIVTGEELYYQQPIPSAPAYGSAKTPRGEWYSNTQIDFASRPGHPSKNELVLPDGTLRSMTGTLRWDAARLINPDRGYDEQASIDGGNKWIWWYIIPKPGSPKLMTVVASDNPPSVGPTGHAIYKVCWVDYRNSGNMLKVRQTGNRFDHTYRDVYADYNISDESSYTSVSLDNFVPETAAIARLYQRCIVYGTQASQDRWYVRICASANDSDLLHLVDIRSPWDIQRTPRELTSIASEYIPSTPHTIAAVNQTTRAAAPSYYMSSEVGSFEAPLFTDRTLYKKRDRVSGSQNDLSFDGLQAYGWVDEWIEP